MELNPLYKEYGNITYKLCVYIAIWDIALISMNYDKKYVT